MRNGWSGEILFLACAEQHGFSADLPEKETRQAPTSFIRSGCSGENPAEGDTGLLTLILILIKSLAARTRVASVLSLTVLGAGARPVLTV
jgi:hypothetical protein